MDQDKLRKDVEAIVSGIFSEKEEADMRTKTEEALRKAASSIEDLTTTLEEKSTEVEDLKVEVSEKEASINDLNSKLEAAGEEIETLKKNLDETETSLEEIKKDRAADVRMTELDESGVGAKDENARETQVNKVREMSDEEFASYKEELVSVRQAVLDEIAAATEKNKTETEEVAEEKQTEEAEEEKAEETEEAAEEEETSEEASEEESEEASEEEEDVVPANVDRASAISAALNMEGIFPSEDVMTKYAKLGEAMAKEFKEAKK